MANNTAVYGPGIEEAVDSLRQAGFRNTDISVWLSVHCGDSEWVKRAKYIVTNTGASDVASASEVSADLIVTDKPFPKPTNQGV